jgi:beta-hydroxyacyl-ACP dehydratase FabZ
MSFLYETPFGVETIMKIIPHRYPMLLLDRVIELGESTVRAEKCLTMNEGIFQGHFPDHPVYPGVLQIETMAQAGAVWILSKPENAGKIAYLMKVTEAKFRRPAVPGDRLVIQGTLLNLKSRTGQIDATISVDDKVISSASIFFAFQRDAGAATAAAE